MKNRWYVVQDDCAIDTGKQCRNWTVSRSPAEPGWATDGGYPGYGLTYAQAKELADAANVAWASSKTGRRLLQALKDR